MSTVKAPTLYHIRALARTSKVLDPDSSPACPSTPPFRSHATVPFLWEDAPGKPKLPGALLLLPSSAAVSPALADAGATARVGGDVQDGAQARPVLLKLKLPPRLQAAEHPLSSPKTVLQGPYFGGGGGGNKPPRPLRRIMSTASCRRVGGGLFVWRKGVATATATASAGSNEGGHCQLYAVAPDESCCSPAASSASSSSSSSSMSYLFDDHSRRQADGCEDSEDGEVGDDGANGSVRITRFRRNRSLPTMSRSHLWANIRKGAKQISPWR